MRKLFVLIVLLLCSVFAYSQSNNQKQMTYKRLTSDTLLLKKIVHLKGDTLLVIQNDTVYWMLLSDIVIDSALYADYAKMSGTMTIRVNSSMTLPKMSLMVLAKNDITLVLPSITIADSGITITVKNVGSYMDEIHLTSGATIADSLIETYLTRWNTITLVSDSGQWYTKEKSARGENTYYVAASASFTTPKQAVDFFNEHGHAGSTIILGSASYPVSSTIVVNNINGYSLAIEGMAYPESKLVAATGLLGKPMIRAITPLVCKQFYADATTLSTYGTHAGEDFVHLLGNKKYYEIKDFTISGFWDGIIDSTDASFYTQEGDFNNCHNSGIKVCGANDSTIVRFGAAIEFNGCDKGVWLYKADKAVVYIDGGTKFTNTSANDTCVAYNPTLFTNTLQGYIVGTVFNNIGTFLGGFDFTRTDSRDANWYVQNNAGEPDRNPNCKINGWTNVTTTTIAAGGTFQKDNYTNSSSTTCKFTIANNRATYQPVNHRIVSGNVSMTAQTTTSAGTTIYYTVVKNGNPATTYGRGVATCKVANTPYPAFFPFIVTDMTAGDYIEIWVTGTTGDVVTTNYVNWIIDSK